MATKTKWFFFWLISGSFLAGILAVCFVVSAVNWLGSETFCSTGCHTMNGVAYAWKQGSHARTPSGKTADCSDCHLYNASENTLGPLGYISLLGHKIVAASHSAYGQVIGHFATPTQWVEQRPGIEAQEKQWFVDNNYHTCRGCHDLSLACMTRRILALVLGMLYIRISRLTAWLVTKTWATTTNKLMPILTPTTLILR